MISLYLLPNETRLAKTEMISGKLQVIALESLPSYWKDLTADSDEMDAETGISKAALSLSAMFRKARQLVRTSGEEFYVVVPDSVFCLVKCFRESEIEASIEMSAADAAEMPLEDLSLAIPFKTRPSIETVKTVFAVPKEIIQRIVDAAGEEGVTLASVEPASVAYLRASGDYNHEHYFLETFSDSAVFTAYSPLGGIFRMEDPLLSTNRLLDLPASVGDMDVRRVLADLEAMAEDRFRTASDDVGVVFISGDHRLYEKFPSMAKRLKELPFAPDILAAPLDIKSPQDWMASIGTFFQDEREEAPIYAKKLTYLTCLSGNLLPQGIQTNAKLFRVIQRVKHVSRILICVGVALLAAFPAASIYFGSIGVPQDLQDQFERSQNELPILEKDIVLIAKAKKEHCRPIKGFMALLSPRPETLGFTTVRIGDSAGTKGAWIEADLVSKDPLTIQDYAASMAADKTFGGASIIRIGTDSSGYKTATVMIRKGEADEQ